MERDSQFSGFLNSLPKVISILYIFYCRKDRMPSGSFQHGLLEGLLFFYQSQIQNERQTRLAFYLFDLKKLPFIILIIFVLHDLNSIENNEICVMKKDSDNNHLATLKNRQNCLPTYFSNSANQRNILWMSTVLAFTTIWLLGTAQRLCNMPVICQRKCIIIASWKVEITLHLKISIFSMEL